VSKTKNFNKTHNKNHQHKLCAKNLRKCYMGYELLGEDEDGDEGEDDSHSGDIDDLIGSFDLGADDSDPMISHTSGGSSVRSTSKTVGKKRKGLRKIFNISLDKNAMRKSGMGDFYGDIEEKEKKKKKKKKKIGLGWGNPLTPGASPAGMVAGPGESIDRKSKKSLKEENKKIRIDTIVRHVDTIGRDEHKYVILAGNVDSNELYGHMDIGVVGDQAHVEWVETKEEYRRLGVASAIYRELKSWAKKENLKVIGGMRTPEGEKLYRQNKKVGISESVVYRATSPEEAFAILTKSKKYWGDDLEEFRKGQMWFSDRGKAEQQAKLRNISYILVADSSNHHPVYAINFETGSKINLNELRIRLVARNIIKETIKNTFWDDIDAYPASRKKENGEDEESPIRDYVMVAHPPKVKGY